MAYTDSEGHTNKRNNMITNTDTVQFEYLEDYLPTD